MAHRAQLTGKWLSLEKKKGGNHLNKIKVTNSDLTLEVSVLIKFGIRV